MERTSTERGGDTVDSRAAQRAALGWRATWWGIPVWTIAVSITLVIFICPQLPMTLIMRALGASWWQAVVIGVTAGSLFWLLLFIVGRVRRARRHHRDSDAC